MVYERAKKIAEEYLYRINLAFEDADDLADPEAAEEILENIHAFEYYIDSIWKIKKIKDIIDDPDYDMEEKYYKICETINKE